MNQPELRDIHLPDVALWWPPAPGWWLLAALLLLLLLGLTWLFKSLKHRSPRYYSLQELRRIRASYVPGQSDSEIAARINTLLRRTLISYRGRRGAASTTGRAWAAQLNELAPGNGFDSEQLQWLTHDRYQPERDCDIDRLLQSCERWIKSLPRKVTDVPD